jgi:hypothetical protein
MIIFKLLTYLAGAVTIGLFGFMYTVLDENGMLDEVARIPADDITTFHIVAGVIIVWLIFGLVMKVVARGILIGLLVLALAAEGTFVGLNLSGYIEPEIVDQLKEKATDIADELSEKAKDLIDN